MLLTANMPTAPPSCCPRACLPHYPAAAAAADRLDRRQLGYLLARQGVQLNLEEGPTAVEVCAGQGLGKLVAVGKVLSHAYFPCKGGLVAASRVPACAVRGFACNQLLWRNRLTLRLRG